MSEASGLGLVLDQVAKDKNIDRDVLVETLEQAILTAAKSVFGCNREMEAKFNEETGQVDLFQFMNVVEQTPPMPGARSPLDDAQQVRPRGRARRRAAVPDLLPTTKDSRRPRSRTTSSATPRAQPRRKSFGRIAAQTAKQVISSACATPSATTSSTSTRTARASSSPASSAASSAATSSSTSAAPRRCCRCASRCRARSYRAGDRIVAYVLDIDRSARGPQIILSRAHKGLLEKLFEMEVPEIYEKIVRIEASAARAGRAREDRGHLARSRRRSGRRLRRHEGLARPGGRAGAARREDRHRALRSTIRRASSATRSRRPRCRA